MLVSGAMPSFVMSFRTKRCESTPVVVYKPGVTTNL
jgi:hypothetical protein